MVREFKAFLTESDAFALAVGVIIGAATSKLVSAVADDVIMPVIGLLLPGADWRTAKFVLRDQNAILYGHLLGTILDFLIIAWVVFLIVKWLIKPVKLATRTCPECMEIIPAAAKRCKACTASV